MQPNLLSKTKAQKAERIARKLVGELALPAPVRRASQAKLALDAQQYCALDRQIKRLTAKYKAVRDRLCSALPEGKRTVMRKAGNRMLCFTLSKSYVPETPISYTRKAYWLLNVTPQ